MKGTCKTITATFCLMLLITVNSVSHAFAQKLSPRAYIERYKDAAIRYMEEYGCPASIILGIAMHESANGNSRVARYLNNHFGIKGPNDSKEIRSAYKGYDDVEESYADFVDLLKRRKATEQLFDLYEPHEYQKWVYGIARSGYAHSRTWSSQVIGMIRKYDLHELDKKSAENMEVAEISESIETEQYTVKRGDTLYDLARKYGTTVKAIRENNGLNTSRLHIGQQLAL